MRRILFILLLLPIIGFSQKAFPEAYGAGSTATGARGGTSPTVYIVTNLSNSGTGSFRDAVSASNRYIVFNVSGTIELTSSLTITADNLTIAGQTAPAGGITITGNQVFFDTANNLIVRYIRFRPDYNDSGSVDAVNVTSCDNVIFDHVSISWSGDEAISIVGSSDNWTVQNSIIAESATGMLAGDSNSFISTNISLLSNLWYNCSHRFPNVNANRVDVINNVVHNWNTRIMVVSSHDNVQLNEINNYYQRGARPTDVLSATQHAGNWLDIGSSSQRPNIRIYTSGNAMNDVLSATDNQWNAPLYRHRFSVTSGAYAGISQWDAANTDFQSLSQFGLLGDPYPFTPADEAFTRVTNNSGASRYLNGDGTVTKDWDSLDDRYLNDVGNNLTTTYVYQSSGSPTIDIASKSWYTSFHSSVSSTPINSRAGSYDTDSDGMPDEWETATFGDLTQTATGDFDGDGYHNIEEFMNLVDADALPPNNTGGGSSTPDGVKNGTSAMLIAH